MVVALRKESVDRNNHHLTVDLVESVALRKESVDRNCSAVIACSRAFWSLSARRAWIEICDSARIYASRLASLSARRAWIEIRPGP